MLARLSDVAAAFRQHESAAIEEVKEANLVGVEVEEDCSGAFDEVLGDVGTDIGSSHLGRSAFVRFCSDEMRVEVILLASVVSVFGDEMKRQESRQTYVYKNYVCLPQRLSTCRSLGVSRMYGQPSSRAGYLCIVL